MNNQDSVNSQLQIEQYLTDKEVYGQLQQLLKGLIIDQPTSPIDYMISKLEEPQQKRIFIVGPPGVKVQQLALSIADSQGQQKLNTFSIGDQINKQFNKKAELATRIQQAVHKFQYVDDEVVNSIMSTELQNHQHEKRSYIIEGFPKTLPQALFLQRSNVYPTTLIILNMKQQTIVEYCLKKINQLEYFSNFSEVEKIELAKQHQKQYTMNIQNVMKVYEGKYFMIDAKDGNMQRLIIETDRMLALRGKTHIPKKPIQILIHGYPSTVRTPLGKEIAQKYGLVFVSSPNLISNEIVRETPDGMLMKAGFQKGQLVNEATVLKLVKNRVTQKDCKLRGFVLQGYPKTQTQLQYLQLMGIKPTLFILLADADRSRSSGPQHKQTIEAENISLKFNTFIENNYTGHILKLNSSSPFHNLIQESCFLIQNL